MTIILILIRSFVSI